MQQTMEAANIDVATLFEIMRTHTMPPNSTPSNDPDLPLDKLTPPKLVEWASSLLRHLSTLDTHLNTQIAPLTQDICSLLLTATRNFTKLTEGNLSEVLRTLCGSQESVDKIIEAEAHVSLVQALCAMI